MVTVLLTASALVAVTLTLLGAIGRLRLAGIERGGGFAMIAPDVVLLFFLSFLISGLAGFAGWHAGGTGLLRDRVPPAPR